MLLPRIITALVLIPAVILVLLYLPPLPFFVATGLITLYGAWEWAGLMNLATPLKKGSYVLLTFMVAMGSFVIINRSEENALTFLIMIFLWWQLAFILILFYPKLSEIWRRGVLIRGMMGFLVLIPFWWNINFIRISGIPALFYLLIIIWGADTAAYFTGRKWGKHKLAKDVSPGKTWEGCAGALIGTVLIALITCFYTQPKPIWVPAIILSILTVIFSIVGDLFESMMKRVANVKDSGKLLPGHGGLLDRIDSLTAAAPIFALGIWYISNYS